MIHLPVFSGEGPAATFRCEPLGAPSMRAQACLERQLKARSTARVRVTDVVSAGLRACRNCPVGEHVAATLGVSLPPPPKCKTDDCPNAPATKTIAEHLRGYCETCRARVGKQPREAVAGAPRVARGRKRSTRVAHGEASAELAARVAETFAETRDERVTAARVGIPATRVRAILNARRRAA